MWLTKYKIRQKSKIKSKYINLGYLDCTIVRKYPKWKSGGEIPKNKSIRYPQNYKRKESKSGDYSSSLIDSKLKSKIQ